MNYKNFLGKLLLAALPLTLSIGHLEAIPQSTARPLGLDIIDTVQERGTDANSSAFLTQLPDVMTYISDHTDASGNFSVPLLDEVDSSDVQFAEEKAVRVYFIGEDANFHNSIGSTMGDDFTLAPGDEHLVFPDASTNLVSRNWSTPAAPGTPLLPGDFVDIGILPPDTPLNFFVIPGGGIEPPAVDTLVWWTDPSFNSLADPLDHVMTVVPIAGTDLLLYAWEDLYSLSPDFDGDFTDVFFVVEVVSTPEPETYLLLGTFLGAVMLVRRKQTAKIVA